MFSFPPSGRPNRKTHERKKKFFINSEYRDREGDFYFYGVNNLGRFNEL